MPPVISRLYSVQFNRALQKTLCPRIGRRLLNTTAETLQEGDRAFLRDFRDAGILTKRLRPGETTATPHGEVSHDSIIGARTQDLVRTRKGVAFRVSLPTLEEYVAMTPRVVTPIYPKDANLIISLLDIHASPYPPSTEDHPMFEILEAGTGHGSLTLHLARAIHAANPPSSKETDVLNEARRKGRSTSLTESSGTMDEPGTHPDVASATAEEETKPSEIYETRPRRNAIIHSVDVSPQYSKEARKLVRVFRRGQYINDIEFHVSEVSAWIDQQIILRGLDSSEVTDKAFLSHIVLDLPESNHQLEKAASVLNVNGSLLVLNPSITQIVACVLEIKKKNLPLKLDQVLELGHAVSRGREWDVRAFLPRAWTRAEQERTTDAKKNNASRKITNQGNVATGDEGSNTNTVDQEAIEEMPKETNWGVVCRPQIGNRVTVGAFVGVWKKTRVYDIPKLPAPDPPPSDSAGRNQDTIPIDT